MDWRGPIVLLAACPIVMASSPALAAEPAPDDLPRYDESIPIHAEPPEPEQGPALREVPSDGLGLLAAGGVVTIVGGASLVGGIVLLTGDGSNSDTWPLVLIGGVGLTAGGLLLGWGVPKHRAYRAWQAQQGDRIPPQGLGLVGSGTALMVAGIASAVFSGTIWTTETSPFSIFGPDPKRVAAAKAGVGVGVASFAVGTSLLVSGAVRNKRFGAWRRTQTVRLAPTLVPTRFGLHLGLAGRF